MKNIDARITIFGGIYGLLVVRGVLPRNPKDAKQIELLRQKYGRMATALGFIYKRLEEPLRLGFQPKKMSL